MRPGLSLPLLALPLLVVGGCVSEEAPAPAADFRILVSNMGAGEILELDAQGRFVQPVVTEEAFADAPLEGGFSPSDLFYSDGDLYVANFATGQILAMDAASGGYMGEFASGRWVRAEGRTRLEEPCQMQWVGDELYVLGNDSRNVVVLSRTGALLREIGVEKPLGLGHGFVVTDDHKVIVSVSARHRRSKLLEVWDGKSGAFLGSFAPFGELIEGTDVAMSPSGRLFVADWFGNQVVEYDLATQRRVGVYAGVDHGFSGPVSIAFDPAGNMLLLDRLGVLRAPLATMGFARITEGEHLGFDWARNLTVVPIQ